VEFNRDGTPGNAIIVGRLTANGHRFVANHADAETMRRLLAFSGEAGDEPIGHTVYVFLSLILITKGS